MTLLMNRLLNLLLDAPDKGSGGGKDEIGDSLDLLDDFDENKDKDKDDLDDDADDDDVDDSDDENDKENEDDDASDDKDDKESDKDDDKEGEDDKEGKDKDDKDKEEKDKEGDKKVIEPKDLTAQNLKEYDPKIFKAFPDLKNTIYQNREYNKLFGSVEEAEDAKSDADSFRQLAENTLAKGDPTDLLTSLEKTGKGKVEEFVGNLFDYLKKESQDTYYKTTDPIIAFALRGAEKAATENGDKNLALAVKYISQFVFGAKEVPSFNSGRRREPDPEREKFEKEKEDDRIQRLQEHQGSVYEFTERKLTDLIKTGLDPDNAFNDFVKEALVDKIIGRIGQQLKEDKAFQGQMSALWKRAHKEGFTREAKQRIAHTYLAKAKRIMPAIRAKVRTESGDAGNNGGKERDKDGKRIIPSSSSGGRNRSGSTTDPKKIDWKNKSDEDILAES